MPASPLLTAMLASLSIVAMDRIRIGVTTFPRCAAVCLIAFLFSPQSDRAGECDRLGGRPFVGYGLEHRSFRPLEVVPRRGPGRARRADPRPRESGGHLIRCASNARDGSIAIGVSPRESSRSPAVSSAASIEGFNREVVALRTSGWLQRLVAHERRRPPEPVRLSAVVRTARYLDHRVITDEDRATSGRRLEKVDQRGRPVDPTGFPGNPSSVAHHSISLCVPSGSAAMSDSKFGVLAQAFFLRQPDLLRFLKRRVGSQDAPDSAPGDLCQGSPLRGERGDLGPGSLPLQDGEQCRQEPSIPP